MVGQNQWMVFVLFVCSFAGCAQYQKLPSVDTNVSNGIWSERGAFELRVDDTLIVPAGTEVVTAPAATGQVVVFVQKKLQYFGHPVQRVSITKVRKRLGCAIRRDSSEIQLCTIGDYSTPDGGASVHLRCSVPQGTAVRYAEELSGLMKMDELKDQSDWVQLTTTDNN